MVQLPTATPLTVPPLTVATEISDELQVGVAGEFFWTVNIVSSPTMAFIGSGEMEMTPVIGVTVTLVIVLPLLYRGFSATYAVTVVLPDDTPLTVADDEPLAPPPLTVAIPVSDEVNMIGDDESEVAVTAEVDNASTVMAVGVIAIVGVIFSADWKSRSMEMTLGVLKPIVR